MDIVSQYIDEIILLLGLLAIILLIWNITISFKLKNLKKRFLRFSRGGSVNNLEQMIENFSTDMDEIKEIIAQNRKQLHLILEKLTNIKGQVGIIRYNAFGEQGNDLSFSIAILDEKKNGIVITSIYNRGESNTYAKPLEAGESRYQLSKEEILAIERATK
ncbi:DUF4446 family protein [Tepidibacillus infernus]|uniref:DUF4446 family protein n=1 Tax=Tepidibacillus infernus TaxID=1806172 RepID=UPI003B723B78